MTAIQRRKFLVAVDASALSMCFALALAAQTPKLPTSGAPTAHPIATGNPATPAVPTVPTPTVPITPVAPSANPNSTPVNTALSIVLDGQPIGSQPALNLIPGSGILIRCTNNVTANRIDCSPSYNSALIPTHDLIHANENYCKSTNGTTAYTCSMPNKALTAYQEGQAFLLNADQTCASTCTLNIDGLGPKTIFQEDGISSPAGKLIAGQAQWVWFDGNIFRLMY